MFRRHLGPDRKCLSKFNGVYKQNDKYDNHDKSECEIS